MEGPTGSGKTFLVCALAHQACRQKQSTLYRRVPELVTALARAREKGTHERLMRRLAKVSLLVAGGWGLQGFAAEGRRDLLEIAEQRYGRKSIVIASQIPVDRWPAVIGESTIADAVLDRIVHNAYRIELAGLRSASGTGRRRWTAAVREGAPASRRGDAPSARQGHLRRRRRGCDSRDMRRPG